MTDKLPKYPLLTEGDKNRIRQEIIDNCKIVGDCWIYQGALNEGGYGVKRMNSKLHAASRFMLAFHTRESLNVPFDACHDTALCPYKACCNPAHLCWATHAQNCQERERVTRELKGMFKFWETNAWIKGVFRTEQADPSVERCIDSLNRGKIERKKQSLTGFEAEAHGNESVSPFIPILAEAIYGVTA